MVKTYFLIIFGLFSLSAHSQYCLSGGPTNLADSNVESVDLIGDAGSISFIGCPGVIGVQDLTNLTTTLTAGNLYSANIQFGTCGGNYAGVGEAWIDFNNNQIFEVSESIGTWTGTPPSTISVFNFSVPAGITNGTTRMRICQAENATIPMDPCASFSWGSTMDFSIELTGGVDCSGYVGNNTTDPIIVTTFPYSHTHNSSFCYTNDNNAYASSDVFYLIIPNPGSEALDISLCGSSFDTFLSVFDTDGNTITFNDDGSCGAQSEVSFSTVDLDSAYIVVEGWGTESGDYAINVSESLLSIDENEKEYSLYPNPTNDYFIIEGLSSTDIYIHDISGKLITIIHDYSGTPINAMNLNKGIYFVSYTPNHKTLTKKLIIN